MPKEVKGKIIQHLYSTTHYTYNNDHLLYYVAMSGYELKMFSHNLKALFNVRLVSCHCPLFMELFCKILLETDCIMVSFHLPFTILSVVLYPNHLDF
jgi:hypothetical protein